MIGRTGSGKSTLINNILGRQIAKVGHRPYPETTTVSVYKEEISGVDVTACDTPGLRDSTGHEEDYMNSIKASCSNPDLVIFCHSMDNIRWHNDDEEAIETVTEYLGSEIWKHSLLVLTFADKMIDTATKLPEDEQKRLFKERISDLEGLFHKSLLKNGISNQYNSGGAVSAKGRKDLPGISSWLTELVVACLHNTKDSGKEGFRQIILHRLRFREDDANKDDSNKQEYEWSFVFTPSLCSLMKQ